MAEGVEDRGPSSLRVVNFDAKNPIHQGIMASRDVNHNIDVAKGKDNKKRIIMPVAPGMESEPKQSTRYPSTNTRTEPYVYKEEKPAAKKAAVKKSAPAPKKAAAPTPKPAAKPAPKKTAAPAGPVASGVKIKTDATLAAKAAAEKAAEKTAAEAKRKAERKRQLKEGHNPIRANYYND